LRAFDHFRELLTAFEHIAVRTITPLDGVRKHIVSPLIIVHPGDRA
jgi:hypothetical protein